MLTYSCYGMAHDVASVLRRKFRNVFHQMRYVFEHILFHGGQRDPISITLRYTSSMSRPSPTSGRPEEPWFFEIPEQGQRRWAKSGAILQEVRLPPRLHFPRVDCPNRLSEYPAAVTSAGAFQHASLRLPP